MPAGAVVENQHAVRTRGDLRADFPQVLGHRFTVDRRHDDGGAEQVDEVVAIVARDRWP